MAADVQDELVYSTQAQFQYTVLELDTAEQMLHGQIGMAAALPLVICSLSVLLRLLKHNVQPGPPQ